MKRVLLLLSIVFIFNACEKRKIKNCVSDAIGPYIDVPICNGEIVSSVFIENGTTEESIRLHVDNIFSANATFTNQDCLFEIEQTNIGTDQFPIFISGTGTYDNEEETISLFLNDSFCEIGKKQDCVRNIVGNYYGSIDCFYSNNAAMSISPNGQIGGLNIFLNLSYYVLLIDNAFVNANCDIIIPETEIINYYPDEGTISGNGSFNGENITLELTIEDNFGTQTCNLFF